MSEYWPLSSPHRLIEMVTLHFSDQINYLGKGQNLMSMSSLTLNLPSYLLVGMIVFMVLPMLKSISCWNSTLRVLSLRGSGFCCTIVGINNEHCTQKSSQEFLFLQKMTEICEISFSERKWKKQCNQMYLPSSSMVNICFSEDTMGQ